MCAPAPFAYTSTRPYTLAAPAQHHPSLYRDVPSTMAPPVQRRVRARRLPLASTVCTAYVHAATRPSMSALPVQGVFERARLRLYNNGPTGARSVAPELAIPACTGAYRPRPYGNTPGLAYSTRPTRTAARPGVLAPPVQKCTCTVPSRSCSNASERAHSLGAAQCVPLCTATYAGLLGLLSL